MAYRPEGPISAADVFINILNSASTNLTQILLLQHQKDFSAQRAGTDASETFGTLSGARTPTKPFVIGFIPPDVDVNFVPVERKLSKTGVAGPPVGGGSEPPNLAGFKFGAFIPYSPEFYLKLASVATKLGCQPDDLLAVLILESGLNPTATNYYMDPVTGKKGNPQAKGLNQITKAALPAAKMTEEFWTTKYSGLSASEQLDYVGNYFESVSKGKKLSNVNDLYMVNFAPGFIGASPGTKVFGDGTKSGGINVEQNPAFAHGKNYISAADVYAAASASKNNKLFKQHLPKLQEALAAGPSAGPIVPTAGSGAIMTNGVITDPENDDPIYNSGRNIQIAEGPRLAAADAQTQELRQQILVARSIPALALLVNPSKFTRSYEQTVDTVKVRRGYAVHMWNERPLSISCSGTTAAQYAFRADGAGGITHFNRLHSASYKNLMSLVQVYRNNGHIYRGVTNNDKYNEHVPTISMSVFIYYDGKIYVGSFDDFSVTDDAEKPFNMSYSFKFTVRYEVEVPSSGLGRLLT